MPTRKWGNEKLVNSTTAGGQLRSDVAILDDSRFVVVWQDDGGGDKVIRAQVFNAEGAKLGSEFLVHLAGPGIDQINPSVTGLGDGSIYVTWNVERQDGHFDTTGKILELNGVQRAFMEPTPFGSVNHTDDSEAARLGSGIGAVAVWLDALLPGGVPTVDVKYRVFSSTGIGGPTLTANINTNGAQADPAVAVSPDASRFVIAWDDYSNNSVRGRMFNSDGSASSNEFVIAPDDVFVGRLPSVAWLNNVQFAVAWKVGRSDGATDDIRVQIFNFAGVPVTGPIPVNSTTLGDQQAPMVAALPNAGFVVAWEDFSGAGADNSGAAIRLQAFDGQGVKVGGEIVVNTTTSGDQLNPSIATLPDGRVVVTWTDFSQTGGDSSGSAIRMQIVDPRDGIVTGSSQGEILYGHDLVNDEINAGASSDILIGLGGNDLLDGGTGSDTAKWSGSLADYAIDFLSDLSFKIGDLRPGSPDGTDTAKSIEFFQFEGQTLTYAQLFQAAPLTTAQLIAQLYIGYFNRSPDVPGMNHWLANFSSYTLDQVAGFFAAPTQAETVALYPFLANPQAASYNDVVEFVTDAYFNLFGRTVGGGDQGVRYWATSIAKDLGIAVPVFGDPVVDGSAPFAPSVALLFLINGALGNDALTVAHKMTVGLYYESQVQAGNIAFSIASAKAALSDVTFNPQTVASAIAAIDASGLVSDAVVDGGGLPLHADDLGHAAIDVETTSDMLAGIDAAPTTVPDAAADSQSRSPAGTATVSEADTNDVRTVGITDLFDRPVDHEYARLGLGA